MAYNDLDGKIDNRDEECNSIATSSFLPSLQTQSFVEKQLGEEDKDKEQQSDEDISERSGEKEDDADDEDENRKQQPDDEDSDDDDNKEEYTP